MGNGGGGAGGRAAMSRHATYVFSSRARDISLGQSQSEIVTHRVVPITGIAEMTVAIIIVTVVFLKNKLLVYVLGLSV